MSLSNTQHRVVNDPQRLEHNWITRDSDNNNDIDWRKFRKTLWRRKKLVGFVFTGFLSLSVVISIYQRVFTPIFRGSFVLLITDPISNDKRSSAAADASLFEQLALNTTNNDIPNLIEVLQSPLLLDPSNRISSKHTSANNQNKKKGNHKTRPPKKADAG